jgi:hypothetical protein
VLAPKGRPLTRPGRITGAFSSFLLLATLGCGERTTDLVRVEALPLADSTRLTLVPAPGVRINAALKPALRLQDGTIHRFDSPHITADSAYFTAIPEVTVAGNAVRGRVTASVCPQGLAVCRVVEFDY